MTTSILHVTRPGETAPHSRTRPTLLAVAISIWALAAVLGLVRLWRYETSAGHTGVTPIVWPAASVLQPEHERFTLVLLAHPHCPCSRATIGELALIMAQCRDRLRAHVLFVRPAAKLGDRWEQTDLWRHAAEIPGVAVSTDVVGVEAARFGAATSGHAMLFDPAQRLVFSGGITASRGHSGDNAGRDAIVKLVQPVRDAAFAFESTLPTQVTPVYGCPLARLRPPSCDQRCEGCEQ